MGWSLRKPRETQTVRRTTLPLRGDMCHTLPIPARAANECRDACTPKCRSNGPDKKSCGKVADRFGCVWIKHKTFDNGGVCIETGNECSVGNKSNKVCKGLKSFGCTFDRVSQMCSGKNDAGGDDNGESKDDGDKCSGLGKSKCKKTDGCKYKSNTCKAE